MSNKKDDEYLKAFELIFKMGFIAFCVFVFGFGLGLYLIFG